MEFPSAITFDIDLLISGKFNCAIFLSILGRPSIFNTLPKKGHLNNSVFVSNLLETGRA